MLMFWYCGKMPSSPSFHPLLSLCNINSIANVIIILLCEAECVIKSKIHFNLLQVHDKKKSGEEGPVWSYQLFAAWQSFYQIQTSCFLRRFDQCALKKDLKLTTMLTVEANRAINYHAVARE